MNDHELVAKVNSCMYLQCRDRGYAASVDVLMDIGILQKDKYEDWRFGRVSYLERVCTINLHKLSTIRHQMRVYAQKAGLKPSFCYYKQWGTKKKDGQRAWCKILCKRNSTKSRMALGNRAERGLKPLSTKGSGGRGGMRAACGVNAGVAV